MAQRFMFTSISKQPIDLGDISAQTQATCEIWEMEPNFKYLLREGMKTYVRSTFGTTNFHFPLLLTPSLYTVRTRTSGCKDTLGSVQVTSNGFCNPSPKAGVCQVRLLEVFERCNPFWLRRNVTLFEAWKEAAWDRLQLPCHFGGGTQSSRSQQVSESGCGAAAPASDTALILGFKHGLGAISLLRVVTSNTWDLSCVIPS